MGFTYTHSLTILSALSNNWSILVINELSEHNYPSNKRSYIAEFYKRFFHQSEEVKRLEDSTPISIKPKLNLVFKMKCKKPSSSSCVGSFLYEFNTLWHMYIDNFRNVYCDVCLNWNKWATLSQPQKVNKWSYPCVLFLQCIHNQTMPWFMGNVEQGCSQAKPFIYFSFCRQATKLDERFMNKWLLRIRGQIKQ